MTYRPIGVDHTDDCFDTDEAHRCDACRRYGLPIDDRDTKDPTMTEQIITVALAEGIVRRLASGSLEVTDAARIASAARAALPHEWVAGQLAYVGVNDYTRLAEWDGSVWVTRWTADRERYEWAAPHLATKVEPIRTLGPDEIAMRRIDQDSADEWRGYSEALRIEGFHDEAILAGAYADALDAADGAS